MANNKKTTIDTWQIIHTHTHAVRPTTPRCFGCKTLADRAPVLPPVVAENIEKKHFCKYKSYILMLLKSYNPIN